MVTRKPRLSSKVPSEAAARPLPSELTTPPVTKIVFTGAKSYQVLLFLTSNILRHRPCGSREHRPARASGEEISVKEWSTTGKPAHSEGQRNHASNTTLTPPQNTTTAAKIEVQVSSLPAA